ncbi:hypothetical protein [Microbacterium sp. WCS2018Hpa-9]|uniref:hypothetical protein n=1 Tax=Microbacterium sp. WCS2018Hpa-9 TaxID=3073635 RepID=UPI00288BE85F|nr:hypothetical protein [Microbacterium sp. WCS2018Hpa-9]
MTWQDAGRVDRRPSGDAHPGWGWGVVLVPAAVGLAALGLFFIRSLGTGAGILIGVALIAWAVSLAMPFFVIAWYAAQAAWKASRERSGRTFAAPSRELRRIGFGIRWSFGARGLMFSPASYDGPDLPMLVIGKVFHYLAIAILVMAGLVAALVGIASPR